MIYLRNILVWRILEIKNLYTEDPPMGKKITGSNLYLHKYMFIIWEKYSFNSIEGTVIDKPFLISKY